MKIMIEIDVNSEGVCCQGTYTTRGVLPKPDVVLLSTGCLEMVKQALIEGRFILEPSMACGTAKKEDPASREGNP